MKFNRRALVPLMLLLAFPIISYIYLKFGYNFRLNALNELQPKMTVTEFDFTNENEKIGVSGLKGHVTLVYNADSDNTAILSPIYDEFNHREEFQMIGISEDNKINKSKEQWYIVQGKYPYQDEIALIDTGLQIRNYYQFDSLSFQKLGIHIPIVMPRVPEKDIKMKNQDK